MAGRWNVSIEYFTSKTQYTWILEQDQNWIQGIHSGKFATQNIAGTMEGDMIKIKSQEGEIENRINFTFTGKVTGDSIDRIRLYGGIWNCQIFGQQIFI